MKRNKTIKIAHLYYDLMNLYGESGNVRAFKRFLERQGVDAEVHFLTIGDKIDFMAYDFFYMGAGSEENQTLVLEDLMQYRDEIKESVESGKTYFITGNSMELFGRKIRFQGGRSLECLGIFEYQAYEEENRLVSEIIYKYNKLPEDKGYYILGFKNCSCNIVHNEQRMFEYPNSMNYKNFYTMNFIGPFLVRNPYFTNMLVENLLNEKGYDYTPIVDTIEFKAYHEYMKNFISNDNLD